MGDVRAEIGQELSARTSPVMCSSFCHFTYKKEPYEQVIYSEKNQGSGRLFYVDVCDYDEVIKLSKKLKSGYYA